MDRSASAVPPQITCSAQSISLHSQSLWSTCPFSLQEYVGTLRWGPDTRLVNLPTISSVGVLEDWQEYLTSRLDGTHFVEDDALKVPDVSMLDGVLPRTCEHVSRKSSGVQEQRDIPDQVRAQGSCMRRILGGLQDCLFH